MQALAADSLRRTLSEGLPDAAPPGKPCFLARFHRRVRRRLDPIWLSGAVEDHRIAGTRGPKPPYLWLHTRLVDLFFDAGLGACGIQRHCAVCVYMHSSSQSIRRVNSSRVFGTCALRRVAGGGRRTCLLRPIQQPYAHQAERSVFPIWHLLPVSCTTSAPSNRHQAHSQRASQRDHASAVGAIAAQRLCRRIGSGRSRRIHPAVVRRRRLSQASLRDRRCHCAAHWHDWHCAAHHHVWLAVAAHHHARLSIHGHHTAHHHRTVQQHRLLRGLQRCAVGTVYNAR